MSYYVPHSEGVWSATGGGYGIYSYRSRGRERHAVYKATRTGRTRLVRTHSTYAAAVEHVRQLRAEVQA